MWFSNHTWIVICLFWKIDALYEENGSDCSVNKDAFSAYTRATTPECKEAILRFTCLMDSGKLFPSKLPSYCSLRGSGYGEHVGCFKDELKSRAVSGAKSKSNLNTPQYCIDLCLNSGYPYAGVEFGVECWCGDSYDKHGPLPQAECNVSCPQNTTINCGGTNAIDVYRTGYGSRPEGAHNEEQSPAVLDSEMSHMARILFMFTWNGRAWRQVKRLFKQIYHVNHYYYIHVDVREDYLYRQALTLADQYDNVRVVRNRIATIWGGASLLQMLLQTMREALDMTDWHWDFYLNLSESDYPIKSLEELTAFLSANKGKNFLKSHGPDTPSFLRKQGLLRTFYECDYHLWRVGNRTLPTGIRVDGGSDWICLNRKFAQYVTSSQDELVQGLNQYFAYALLSAEAYFHTVLQNSEYCETFVDNNLRRTNWNRKRGCLCQYKHIVDWCGCSPLDYTDTQNDKTKLVSTGNLKIFFARKFEAVVNNRIVNWLDEDIHSPYPRDTPALDSYWQSVYDEQDPWKRSEDSQYTYYMSLSRNTIQKVVKVNQVEKCHLSVKHINQVHLLKENEDFSGMLVHFTTLTPIKKGSNKNVEWEVQLKPKEKFVLIKPFGDISRILKLQVGSIFDAKEKLFRDYGRMIGTTTQNLTVVQVWQGGLEVNVTLVLTDPLLRIAYVRNATIPQGMNNNIVITKISLPIPRLPGQWKAKLVYQNVLVAETTFPIVPEIYDNRQLANKLLPYTTDTDYHISTEHLHLYGDIIKTDEETPSLTEAILSQSPMSLMSWVDDLVGEYWKPHGGCVVGENADCDLLPQCNSTSWSSLSPDPKSEIGSINPLTGKITQIISKS